MLIIAAISMIVCIQQSMQTMIILKEFYNNIIASDI